MVTLIRGGAGYTVHIYIGKDSYGLVYRNRIDQGYRCLSLIILTNIQEAQGHSRQHKGPNPVSLPTKAQKGQESNTRKGYQLCFMHPQIAFQYHSKK